MINSKMIAENIDNITYHNIFISESNKNTTNNFIKIFYSNNIFFLNSIYIKLEINNLKFHNNKILFDSIYNIEKIKNLESFILNNVNTNKEPVFKLTNLLDNNILKYGYEIYKYNILKISGIWETTENYGITFKILESNKTII
tara:strand:+ start:175 stop:603 length:429 start_codon:yes stop_codon:yes gene_type:complete